MQVWSKPRSDKGQRPVCSTLLPSFTRAYPETTHPQPGGLPWWRHSLNFCIIPLDVTPFSSALMASY